MKVSASLPLYDELVNNFESQNISEVDFFNEKRKEGFENFKRLGFPTRKHEDWKYTGVTSFLNDEFSTSQFLNTKVDESYFSQFAIPEMDCYEFVLLNGKLQHHAKELPEFIRVRSINDIKGDRVAATKFGSATDIDSTFAALNTAMFTDGFYLEIEAGAILEKPLHIIHLFKNGENAFIQPRNLVIIGRGASISILESFVSEEGNSKLFINNLVEVVANENSFVDHYILEVLKSGSRLVNQTDVSVARSCVYNNYTFSLPGAELIRNNLNVNLDSSSTEAHLFGLYLGAGNQLIDNHSMVNHKLPNCDSNEIYKGVLLDNSTGVFNGKIYVHQDAQKTNAFQQNNNLLLSNKAVINTKPQLEIFADDVKCSHGTTIGQLSTEALFYLRSRGIGENSARALLVNAFAFDVTSKIKIPELKKYVNSLITKHIPGNSL